MPRGTVRPAAYSSRAHFELLAARPALPHRRRSDLDRPSITATAAATARDELDDYDQFLDRAAPVPPRAGGKARSVAQSGYGKANPGRDYLYLKASVREPFDWVYGRPR